ncbi:hypothetical protein V8C86DRAFT_2677328 [Haematococcus lacustris]
MPKPWHRSRSPLAIKHALARDTYMNNVTATKALELLRYAFPTTSGAPPDSMGQLAALSSPNTLLVPRGNRSNLKPPLHVMDAGFPHPWELLPMRAAALQQYPNFFAQSTMFFGSIQTAVTNRLEQQIVRPSKLGLDLAKLLRNLGILRSFEVVQRLTDCRAKDYVWPAGQEPAHYSELALYPYAYLKLGIRWDAHRPIWEAPDAPVTHLALHTSDPLPLAVRNLSRVNFPQLVTPEDLDKQARVLPCGVFVLWHHQLGLTLDVLAQHYGISCLALAHLSLPPSQVAQIRAALRSKAAGEAGLPLNQTLPLQAWSLHGWVRDALQRRSALLSPGSPALLPGPAGQPGGGEQPALGEAGGRAAEVQQQREELLRRVQMEQQQEAEVARRAAAAGEQLHQELVAYSLRAQLPALQAALGDSPPASGPGPAAGPASSGSQSGRSPLFNSSSSSSSTAHPQRRNAGREVLHEHEGAQGGRRQPSGSSRSQAAGPQSHVAGSATAATGGSSRTGPGLNDDGVRGGAGGRQGFDPRPSSVLPDAARSRAARPGARGGGRGT